MLRLVLCVSLVVVALTAAVPDEQQQQQQQKQPLVPRLAAQSLVSTTTATTTWVVVGPYAQGRCQTSANTDGTSGTDFTTDATATTLEACKTACAAAPSCVAVGLTSTVCQLWSTLPSTAVTDATATCLRKVVTATGTSLCGDNHFAQLGLGQSKSVNTLHNIAIPTTAAGLGSYHTLFLNAAANKVFVSGNNGFGQLGLGDQAQRSVPTELALSYNIKMVAAGGGHSIVITTDGRALSFGRNSHGQLCNNEKGGALPVPQLLPVSNIKSVAVGFTHTLFTANDNTLLGCGNNKDGQLGMSNFDEYLTPTPIQAITHVVDVAAGAKHTVVLTELQGGSGATCGMGDREILTPTDHTYTSELANPYYPCPLGNHIDADCGHVGYSRSVFGSMTVDIGSPRSVGGVVVQGTLFPAAEWVTSAEVSYRTTATGAFTSLGSFTISVTSANEKFYIEFPTMITVQAVKVTPSTVSSGRRSAHLRLGVWTCASTYEVKTFGSNTHGQLGFTTSTPSTPANVPLESFDGNPAAIAAGQSHSVVALSSGKVVVFGFNYYGQLGLSSTGSLASDIQDREPTYMQLPSGKLASKVAAGAHHTVVQMTDNTVYAVGRNYDGQLGTGVVSPVERSLQLVASSFTPQNILAGGGVTMLVA